jgi:hypothetical protein
VKDFLKILFDNKLHNVDELQCHNFDKREEQQRLINLLEEWDLFFGDRKTKI